MPLRCPTPRSEPCPDDGAAKRPLRAFFRTVVRRRRLAVIFRRIGMIVLGIALMVSGALLVPSPLPLGFVLFVAGLVLVARGSRRMRHLIKVARRAVPPFSRGLDRVKHRLPEPLQSVIERSDPGP